MLVFRSISLKRALKIKYDYFDMLKSSLGTKSSNDESGLTILMLANHFSFSLLAGFGAYCFSNQSWWRWVAMWALQALAPCGVPQIPVLPPHSQTLVYHELPPLPPPPPPKMEDGGKSGIGGPTYTHCCDEKTLSSN